MEISRPRQLTPSEISIILQMLLSLLGLTRQQDHRCYTALYRGEKTGLPEKGTK